MVLSARRYVRESVYFCSPERKQLEGLLGWREARVGDGVLPSVGIHREELDVLWVPVEAYC